VGNTWEHKLFWENSDENFSNHHGKNRNIKKQSGLFKINVGYMGYI
jgi:hypothetical protein